MKNITKTIVFASLIAAMVLPFSAMNFADAQEGLYCGHIMDYYDIVILGDGLDKNQIWGTAGNDLILGSDLDNMIYGLDGDDCIYGYGGDDIIYAGHGDDIVYGGDGTDFIWGNAGNDLLYGEKGDDFLYGNSGERGFTDHTNGGEGTDRCYHTNDKVSCENTKNKP